MRKRGLLISGLLALLTACSQDSPLVGTERGACYRNSTCNAGLICLSQLCVRPPDTGIVGDAQRPPEGPPQGMMPPPWGERGMRPPPWGDGGMQPPPWGDKGTEPQSDGSVKPPTDAGADHRRDAGSSTGLPSPDVIECGNLSCATTSKICCVGSAADGGTSAKTFTCVDSTLTCAGNTVQCDEPGDCSGGQVCCRPSGGIDATCVASTDCTASTARLRCHVDTDCPLDRPKCCVSANIMGGGSCKTAC